MRNDLRETSRELDVQCLDFQNTHNEWGEKNAIQIKLDFHGLQLCSTLNAFEKFRNIYKWIVCRRLLKQ